MSKKIIRAFHFGVSIKENKTLELKCQSFIFQNQGNTMVYLDDYFELPPSEALSVNLNAADEMFFQSIRIRFGVSNEYDDGQAVRPLLNYAHIPSL